MKYALALIAALAFAAPAAAQHSHGAQKGPNGGQMEDVAGVHAELVTSGNTITINVFDEGNKPIATTGFSGAALVVRGSERETVTLAPSGDNALKGDAKKAAGGAAITVTLKTAAGKSGQARFKP
jgi:nitrogen fixation protein FixH